MRILPTQPCLASLTLPLARAIENLGLDENFYVQFYNPPNFVMQCPSPKIHSALKLDGFSFEYFLALDLGMSFQAFSALYKEFIDRGFVGRKGNLADWATANLNLTRSKARVFFSVAGTKYSKEKQRANCGNAILMALTAVKNYGGHIVKSSRITFLVEAGGEQFGYVDGTPVGAPSTYRSYQHETSLGGLTDIWAATRTSDEVGIADAAYAALDRLDNARFGKVKLDAIKQGVAIFSAFGKDEDFTGVMNLVGRSGVISTKVLQLRALDDAKLFEVYSRPRAEVAEIFTMANLQGPDVKAILALLPEEKLPEYGEEIKKEFRKLLKGVEKGVRVAE